MRIAPLVLTRYWRTDWPDSQIALPEAEIAVKTAREFCDAKRSPMRPPQPVVAPSGSKESQVLDWSLCEKRLAGFGCERSAYCALVVGITSGPVLGRMARRRSV